MVVAALSLPSTVADSTETDLIGRLLEQLGLFTASNQLKTAYYEGQARVRDLGISVPPEIARIDTIVGWPGIAVDVLEERLDWLGWIAPGNDDFGLSEVYRANQLGPESSLGHLDGLIYGTSFAVVGSGFDGEPDPLITVESPLSMTCGWDRRSRRVSSALAVTASDNGQAYEVTLYRPDETVWFQWVNGMWRTVERDVHMLGRVPVVRLVNRPWGARREGRSEITHAIRSLTDQAVRTLLGAEVAREFFSAPQRWIMGADQSSFVDAQGNPVPAWESYLGRFLALSGDEDGNLPTVGQFPASSPAPYLDQVRALAQLFAGEAGLPASYLGFVDANPASADAIKAGEARLLKRAERRQGQYGLGWIETGRLALMVRDGQVPPDFDQVSLAWRDPSTPTRAAATDAAVKLVQAGVLPADSAVTYDLIGLSPSDQQRLTADVRRAGSLATVLALRDASATVTDPATVDLASRRTAELAPASSTIEPDKLKAMAEALGQLIRSGVEPTDAARIVGLGDIGFTGAVPVTLRQPANLADDLEET